MVLNQPVGRKQVALVMTALATHAAAVRFQLLHVAVMIAPVPHAPAIANPLRFGLVRPKTKRLTCSAFFLKKSGYCMTSFELLKNKE